MCRLAACCQDVSGERMLTTLTSLFGKWRRRSEPPLPDRHVRGLESRYSTEILTHVQEKAMTPRLYKTLRRLPKILSAASLDFSYGKVDPRGRPHLVCPQCGMIVLLCETLDQDQRQQIAAARKEDVRQAWDLLARWLALDEGDSKPIVLHVCRQPGICHNCEQPIPRGSLMCSHCLAVNLDW